MDFSFLLTSGRAFAADGFAFFGGGIVEDLCRATNCCRRNVSALRQYPFVVGKFGHGASVSGGLCVMRSKRWGGWQHLSYVIRWCCDGRNCEGVVGVEMLLFV